MGCGTSLYWIDDDQFAKCSATVVSSGFMDEACRSACGPRNPSIVGECPLICGIAFIAAIGNNPPRRSLGEAACDGEKNTDGHLEPSPSPATWRRRRCSHDRLGARLARKRGGYAGGVERTCRGGDHGRANVAEPAKGADLGNSPDGPTIGQ